VDAGDNLAVVADAWVERRGADLVVGWELEGSNESGVDIAAGLTPDAIDHVHALTVAVGVRSATLPGLSPGRHFVSVAPHGGGGAVVLAERRLPFEGVTNFRDLGGYPTSDGRRTRWGLVFRSDALHRLTDSDLVAYASLGLRVVYDLRGDVERERYPDPFPSFELPLISETNAPDVTVIPASHEDGERMLRDLYRRMLTSVAPSFGQLMAGLAGDEALPAVFHCTGGKDRTGVSAALLLEVLGVPRHRVLDDYELTSRFRLREHQAESYQNLLASGLPAEAAVAVLGAPRWAMAEALEFLDRDLGGVEAYLTGPAGLPASTLDRLRALLVG
jgi:protein-tyrosine phosphatase